MTTPNSIFIFGDTPYYFEFKTRLLSHFSKPKIGVLLKFEVLLFTLQKSQKHNFPPRTGGLTKKVVNFRGSEMYLLAHLVNLHKKFFNAKGLSPYHTVRTECVMVLAGHLYNDVYPLQMMESTMTFFGTIVNQAMTILQSQNKIVSQKKIGGAFRLNK